MTTAGAPERPGPERRSTGWPSHPTRESAVAAMHRSSTPSSGLSEAVLALALVLLHPVPATSQGLDEDDGSFAITPVAVIDVRDGELLPDRTVVVTGDRITAVGPADSVEVPDDARVVDGTGKFLTPGLWDMHVHSVVERAVDLPEDVAYRSPATADWHLPLFVAYGVTGVRNMNDRTADTSLTLTDSVRRRLAEGTLVGPPRFLSAGPSIDGDPPLGSNPVVVRTAGEARRVVDALADAGADFVKPYENLSREAYFALVDQARRRDLPVDGHLPFRVTATEAAEAGQRTVEHPDALAPGCSTGAEAQRERFAGVLAAVDRLSEDEKFLAQFRHLRALYDTWDPDACAGAFRAFRRNDVAVTADLVGFHHVVHAEEVLSDSLAMRFVPAAIRREWRASLDAEAIRTFRSILRPIVPMQAEQVRLFHEAGGTLLAGTDVGVPWQVPGISLHQELALLVEAGLTPLAALRTATLDPARVLGVADALGTVEEGKLADLVLLDANPLEDVTNTREIAAVVVDGRYLDRKALDELLAEAEARAASPR